MAKRAWVVTALLVVSLVLPGKAFSQSPNPEALAAAKDERPALVVTEVLLPGVSGYELCHEIKENFGEAIPIIFVSGTRTEPGDRVAGLLVGADDYLVKPFDPEELLARVRRLLPAALAGGPKTHELTRRELEVLSLLVEGLGQDEIAEKLFISPKTVGKHIEHILRKLGVHSRAQAVALAVRDEPLRSGGSSPEVEAHRALAIKHA